MFPDFSEQPGALFVVATLLPLLSFLILLLAFGLRLFLRTAQEGTLGATIYQRLGGDTPRKWPAYVATGAIALACVCSVAGFILYLNDPALAADHGHGGHSHGTEPADTAKKSIHELQDEIEALNEKLDGEKNPAKYAELQEQKKAVVKEKHRLEHR